MEYIAKREEICKENQDLNNRLYYGKDDLYLVRRKSILSLCGSCEKAKVINGNPYCLVELKGLGDIRAFAESLDDLL